MDSIKPWSLRLPRWVLGAGHLLAVGLLSGCASIADNLIADAIITPDNEVKARDAGLKSMGPHMTMTRPRAPQPGDQARADALARQLEKHIGKYRDVEVAKADGYRSFPPEPPPSLKEVHYVHGSRSAEEKDALNPAQPGSLLYHQTADGGLKLVGAMFTAPPTATLEALDERVPLSVTQWHLHTDICIPIPLWDEQEWRRTTYDGQPLFGVESPISNRKACDSAKGRFAPVIFGWMTHAYVTADVDDVWDQSFGHGGHH